MLFLKTLVSLGLLLFLFSRIDLRELFRELYAAHISYLIIVLAGYFIGQVISSLRWVLLARLFGFQNPFKDFFVFYFIGMFFNLFAPSTVGGDVGRVYFLARENLDQGSRKWAGSMGKALSSVVADRVVGMVVLVGIAATALVIFPAYSLPATIRYATFGLALGILLSCLLLPAIRRAVAGGSHPIVQNFALALEVYTSGGRVLVKTALLSLAIHSIQAASHVLVGWSLDLTIPWSYSFILYPLVGMFMAIPVSFNGIGLREGGYLFMLRRIDVSSEKAVAFGLLWFAIVAVDSMIGGLIFVARKNRGLQPAL